MLDVILMNKYFPLFLTAILSPGFAQARFCEDPARINQQVQDCSDNERFSEAAVLCLEKFEAAISLAKGAVNAGSAMNSAASKSQQSSKQTNAKKDYQLSKATLNTLISQAKAAQEETSKYFDGVVWPEDFDNEELTGDLDEFLKSESCYQDNRELIGKVLGNFDNYISQLIAAKEQGETLEAGTKGNEGGLTSLTQENDTVLPDSAKKKSALPPIKGRPSYRPESDISGTKEEKK